MESSVRTALIGGFAVVCLVVFLASPPGKFVADLLVLIPAIAWAWIIGAAAVVGLLWAVQALRS